jgi:hypothetical protein
MNSTPTTGLTAPRSRGWRRPEPAPPAAQPAARKSLINKHYSRFSRFSRLINNPNANSGPPCLLTYIRGWSRPPAEPAEPAGIVFSQWVTSSRMVAAHSNNPLQISPSHRCTVALIVFDVAASSDVLGFAHARVLHIKSFSSRMFGIQMVKWCDPRHRSQTARAGSYLRGNVLTPKPAYAPLPVSGSLVVLCERVETCLSIFPMAKSSRHNVISGIWQPESLVADRCASRRICRQSSGEFVRKSHD